MKIGVLTDVERAETNAVKDLKGPPKPQSAVIASEKIAQEKGMAGYF